MTGWIGSLRPEEWSVIFTGIGSLVMIIGTIIAVASLRVIAKTQHLEAVREFLEDLVDTAGDRKFVYQEFNFSLEESELPPENEERIQRVVNSLNRLGLLLESDLLPPKLVFGICHTMIIRCWYKLEGYVRYHESRVGGRYGRRLARLAARAKSYHDINPQHRLTRIKIDPGPGQEPFIIYETEIKKGLGGIKQKVCWRIKRIFSIY